MRRRVEGLLVLAFLGILAVGFPAPVQAGDLMNVEFLQRHAREADEDVARMEQELRDGLYAQSPSLFSFLVNTVGMVAFTATYYTADTQATRNLGGLGGGLLCVPIIRDYIQGRRASQKTQAMVAQLAEKSHALDVEVKRLYDGLKAESSEARGRLVSLTGEAIVAEVEENLRLERMFRSIDKLDTSITP